MFSFFFGCLLLGEIPGIILPLLKFFIPNINFSIILVIFPHYFFSLIISPGSLDFSGCCCFAHGNQFYVLRAGHYFALFDCNLCKLYIIVF